MGADFLFFDQINKISFSSQEIRFNNKKISSEKIIVACGVWSNELLKKSFKVLFLMRPLKGVSMLFKTKKRLFINNIWYRNIYIAPRDNNFLAVGATEDEKGFESFVTLDEIFTLCNSLWEYLPEIEKLQFINTFVGLRSVLSDGNPVIGSLKKNNDIICAFGHFRHGILLAPITAKIVSDIVLDYKINENLTFFSPNRFNL